jgi:hypothetical protein
VGHLALMRGDGEIAMTVLNKETSKLKPEQRSLQGRSVLAGYPVSVDADKSHLRGKLVSC